MAPLLLLAICLVPVFSIGRAWRRAGSWHFLNPVNSFWLTYVYAGAVQPFLSGRDWIAFYGEEIYLQTLAMFLVLGIAVALGYGLQQAPQWSKVLPDFSVPSSAKVFVCGVLLIGLGLVGYYLVAVNSGGWQYWSSAPRENTNFDLSGYVYTLPRVATLGIMVLLCHAFSRRGATLYKIGVIALGVLNLLWQAYTGTREGTIVMLVILFGSIFAAQRRNPPLFSIPILLAAVFFTFGFIPTFRGGFRDLSFNLQASPADVVGRSFGFFSDPDFGDDAPSTRKKDKGPDLWSDFGMAISVAYYVPARVDYDGGTMLLESFTHGVPRALWPDKTYPESEAWDRFHRVSGISDSLNPAGFRGGPSPTMVGKYFYIGGWFGLVLGGVFSGFCFRVLWEFLQRQLHLVTGVILTVASAGLGGMEMIHPLAWSVNFWLPTVFVPFLAFVWLVREGSQNREQLRPTETERELSTATRARASRPSR